VPEHTSAELRGAGPGRAFLTLTSFTLPPSTYVVDLKTGERKSWTSAPGSDAEAVVQQVGIHRRTGPGSMYLFFAGNRDGRREPDAPLRLRRSTPRRRRFDPMAAAWVEEGGLYAMANLRWKRVRRGVAPRGHAREQAERLRRLLGRRVLIENGYTRPRARIRGVSNGPSGRERFHPASRALSRRRLRLSDLDMVRFMLHRDQQPPRLRSTATLRNSTSSSSEEYSPYQAVRDGPRTRQ
jgi:hypothetical protein